MDKQKLLKDNDNSPIEMPNDLNEVLQDVPKEKQEIIKKTIMQFSMMAMRSEKTAEESLLSKMTPEHITSYLSDSAENMRLSYKSESQRRWFVLAVVVIAAIIFCVVIFIFSDKPELIEKIILAVGGALVGFAGGFGFGKTKKDE